MFFELTYQVKSKTTVHLQKHLTIWNATLQKRIQTVMSSLAFRTAQIEWRNPANLQHLYAGRTLALTVASVKCTESGVRSTGRTTLRDLLSLVVTGLVKVLSWKFVFVYLVVNFFVQV